MINKILIYLSPAEVGIHTRKQKLDQESDQETRKKERKQELDQESDQEIKKKLFFS